MKNRLNTFLHHTTVLIPTLLSSPLFFIILYLSFFFMNSNIKSDQFLHAQESDQLYLSNNTPPAPSIDPPIDSSTNTSNTTNPTTEIVAQINLIPVDPSLQMNTYYYPDQIFINNNSIDDKLTNLGYTLVAHSSNPTNSNHLLTFENLNSAILQLGNSSFNEADNRKLIFSDSSKRTLAIGFMLEALQNSSPDSSNKELAQKMANIVKQNFATHDEQMFFLATLSSYLANDYDANRNPQHPDNNNTDFLNLQKIATRSRDHQINGGICNDIVANIGSIARELDPHLDVFGIQAAGPHTEHFVLLVGDQQKQYVINYGKVAVSNQSTEINLYPESYGMNVRVMGLRDSGEISEIGVYADNYGQFLQQIYENKIAKPSNSQLNTPSFVKILFNANNKFSLGLAGANTQDGATAFVLYGQFKKNTKHQNTLLGVDLGVQAYQEVNHGLLSGYNLVRDNQKPLNIFKFHFNYERQQVIPVIKYLRRHFSVNWSLIAGIGMEGLIGYSLGDDEHQLYASSLNPQQISNHTINKTGLILDGNMGSEIGTKILSTWHEKYIATLQISAGHQLGALYGHQASGVSLNQHLKYLTLFLNEAKANAKFGNNSIKLSSKYQGDALGQSIVLQGNVTIDHLLNSLSLQIGLGYAWALPGWKSKKNYNDSKGFMGELAITPHKKNWRLKFAANQVQPLQISFNTTISKEPKK